MTRAIVGARTSVFNDAKVSHEAQRSAGDAYADANGMTVVGYFEDLGVSATVNPFERRDLGPWLTERIGEYEAIVWSKVDRAFRSSKDCADVAKWAEDNRKCLVFTDDGIVLDYREDPDSFAGMMAKFFLTIASLFGEMELRRFRQRAKDSHDVLRDRDRWVTGAAPLGYAIVDHPSGKGKTLAADPDGRAILHDMANRLLSGDSLTGIADHLNDTGALSNRGRRMVAKGKPVPTWGVASVKDALTSPRTQGVKLTNGQPVLTATGEYIRLGEPTFDDTVWDQIQAAVAERSASGKRRAVSTNPVLHVAYCGDCGASMTRRASNGHMYYRCGRTPVACRGVSMKAKDAHDVLETLMTRTIGGMRATRRVFVPGSDNSAELATVEQSIARLRRESDAGLVDDEDEWLGRLSALTARKRALTATPVRPAGWETVDEDETYAERYTAADDLGKREIVRNAGIRLSLPSDGDPVILLPEPMADALGFDTLPVSQLDSGMGRVLGNYARAYARGDLNQS